MSPIKIKLFYLQTDQNDINAFLAKPDIKFISQSVSDHVLAIAYKEIPSEKPTNYPLLLLSFVFIVGSILNIQLHPFLSPNNEASLILFTLGIASLISFIQALRNTKD